MNKWEQAQEWEKNWWNSCANTVWKDVKQMELVPYLGLKIVPNAYTQYRIPMNRERILDIGGGPSSILLKCENIKGYVKDPCDYPKWVGRRYKECGIDYEKVKGEDIKDGEYDEVWIYNVLQHTEDPEKIIKNALRIGKIVRLFEWIETGVNVGHLHSFTQEQLERWLGGEGKVYNLNSNGLHGQAFGGVFLGNKYDTKTER